MILANVSEMFEAPFSPLAASDMFRQASNQEPPAKRLRLAPDSKFFQESGAAQCNGEELGPLQFYTLQKLQRVTLNSSPSEPLSQHPHENVPPVTSEEPTKAPSAQLEIRAEHSNASEGVVRQVPCLSKRLLQLPQEVSEQEGVPHVASGDPTKAPASSAPLETPTEHLAASEGVVRQVLSPPKPLLAEPQKAKELITSEEPTGAPDSLPKSEGSSDSAALREDELPDGSLPQFSVRQSRTKRERGRRHVPGSCIDLTQSDDEGTERSTGTVEDPPVPATREWLRETPAREEAHRWRQLEGKVCTYPQE